MTTDDAAAPARHPARVLAVLVGVSAVLVLVSLLAPWWAPHRDVMFYVEVGGENNLPMWWNAGLLLVAGLVLFVTGDAAPGRTERFAWRALGALVLLLSLDEATMLHEKLAGPAGRLWPAAGLSYMWLVVGTPLAAGVLVFVLLLGRTLPRRPRWLLTAAFAVYFTGAVGVEVLQELVVDPDGHWFAHRVLFHAEEALEMAGASMMAVVPLVRARPAVALGARAAL